MTPKTNLPIPTDLLALLLELHTTTDLLTECSLLAAQLSALRAAPTDEGMEALIDSHEAIKANRDVLGVITPFLLSAAADHIDKQRRLPPQKMRPGFFDAVTIMDHNLTHPNNPIAGPDDYAKVGEKRQRELRKMYRFLINKQATTNAQTQQSETTEPCPS